MSSVSSWGVLSQAATARARTTVSSYDIFFMIFSFAGHDFSFTLAEQKKRVKQYHRGALQMETDYLKLAAENQKRAREVIAELRIEQIWQRHGATVNLVG